MRLAYADPPYPGKSDRYREQTEVDHAALDGDPDTEVIYAALEMLVGRNDRFRTRRGEALEALARLQANRDQWHAAANQYYQALEELLLYARGNPIVLTKIRTALGINDP